jgi:tellurite resistance protein TerC
LPVTDRYHDARLITQIAGRRYVTPMLLVLLAIGTTDRLFALDSVSAVFGVTRHHYLVVCANAFARLGLRALFLLVTGLLERLIYLSVGLSAILAFIGVKLVLHFIHLHNAAAPEISTAVSLAVILAVLVITTAASLISSRADPTSARTGTLRNDSPARKASRPIVVTEPDDDPRELCRSESPVTSGQE